MDDVVTGVIDEQQAYRLYKDAKSMLRAGGFNLRKFVSNLPSLQKTIDDEKQPTASSSLKEPVGLQETYSKSTLGPPKLTSRRSEGLGSSVECCIYLSAMELIVHQLV